MVVEDDVALVQTGVDDGADEAVDDTSSLMQLSAAEEERLHEAGVSDAVRRLLRDLLRSLENTQARDEGAEYRWGVQCLLRLGCCRPYIGGCQGLLGYKS